MVAELVSNGDGTYTDSDGKYTYELREVASCQYHEDGSTDFLLPYGTGNCLEIYGVYDNAPENTNMVLMRKGKYHDIVACFGTR